MAKPKENLKEWENVPFKTWAYQEQTAMKHNAIAYYLPVWLKILGSWHKNLNFIDGFGGVGAYHTQNDIKNGEYTSNKFGSPIISSRAIAKLESSKTITSGNIVIIDEEKCCLENVEKIIGHLNIQLKGKIFYQVGNFDGAINGFLDEFDKSKGELAPTFFLIDPFGFSGIKMTTLERIMRRPKTEILLNFMYNALQRWMNHPDEKIIKIYDDYFGGDQWRCCKDKRLEQKETELVRLFREKSKQFSKWVYPFKLKFPNQDKTYYYLIHLTNNWRGCSLMKDSFAKFNNGKVEYRGSVIQSSLFEPMEEENKREKFAQNILNHYKGQKIKCEDILACFIDETDLLENEIKKILQQLEKNEKIEIEVWDKRKRRGGIDLRDMVYFKD